MEIKPPVAIAIVAVLVLLVAFVLWKGTSGGQFKAPPPITTGAPGQQAGPGPGGTPKLTLLGGNQGGAPPMQSGLPSATPGR